MTSAEIEALLTAHFALRADPCDHLVALVNAHHGSLDPAEAAALAAHLDGCAECRRLAALLDAEAAPGAEPLARAPRLTRPRAAGATALALVAALSLWVLVPSPGPPEERRDGPTGVVTGRERDHDARDLTPRAGHPAATVELWVDDRPCWPSPDPCRWSPDDETLTLYYQTDRPTYVAALIRDATGDVSALYPADGPGLAPSTAGRGCPGGLCDLAGGLYDAPVGDALVWIVTSPTPIDLDALVDALGGATRPLLGPRATVQPLRLRIR